MANRAAAIGILALFAQVSAACSKDVACDCPDGLTCNDDALCVGNFELVGHEPLRERGMHAGLALYGDYAYVGARADGSVEGHGTVLIVDIADPTDPEVVGEIAGPEEGLVGLTARELRTIPALNLLIVMHYACPNSNRCRRNYAQYPETGVPEPANLKFYDLTDPLSPVLISRFDFPTGSTEDTNLYPHEFFLWQDPAVAGRYLVFQTIPALFGYVTIGHANLIVIDVSDPSAPRQLLDWDAHDDLGLTESRNAAFLHSLSVSDDGRIGYLAYAAGGFFMVDTSELADGLESPRILPLTPPTLRLDYSPPVPGGTHSAIAVPGRDLVLLTDEVYGRPSGYGCPWGWMRLVDVSDTSRPRQTGEYRLAHNDESTCRPPEDEIEPTYTAHNPTVTENLALITWHRAGLQAVDISDADDPRAAGAFVPTPLESVELEDLALNGGVEMWSYPIVRDGLVYAVDIRNGLFILRYTGPFAEELAAQPYLAGESNLDGIE